MRSNLSTIAAMIALIIVCPDRGEASGPGTHVQEAAEVLEILAAEDPDWAALAALPYAQAYLGFGSISPDFHLVCAEFDFGHQKSLSYHLLELSLEQAPEFRLFALGHLCHQGSDNAMEGLMVGAFFAAAPVGVFSLFTKCLDGRGDSEAIVESLGDLIFGDWHRLVDVLFDMWFEDEAAQARAAEVFQWYCTEAAAFLGKDTDCALAQVQLEEKLASAEGIIGLLDRQAAHDLVDMLISQPLEDLVDLASSGVLTSFVSEAGEPTPNFDAEVERLKASPLTDPDFWTLYDDLAHLGPAFTLAQLEHQPPTGAWPIYDKEMVICGNLLSVMRFLPEHFVVVTGLTVDQIQWLGPQGEPLDEAAEDLAGEALSAHVRIFSALPWSGTITGRVRRDLPGFQSDEDPVLGTASVQVDIDPAVYVTTPRTLLEIPFVADMEGGLGFYLELFAGDDALPCFTTSWDRLWGIEALPFALPIYRDNFGTYGHWPPSLPLAAPGPQGASVFVQVQVGPEGSGVDGAAVTMVQDPGGEEVQWDHLTAANGLTFHDWLTPGELEIKATAAGYSDPSPVTIQVVPGEDQWVLIDLDPLPVVSPPAAWDAAKCVPLAWETEGFGGQVATLVVSPIDPSTGTALGAVVELDAALGEGEYCFDTQPQDGLKVSFLVVAIYGDGSQGGEATSGTVTLDGSPPVLDMSLVGLGDDPCELDGAATLDVHGEDPHTDLVALAWSEDGGDWLELPLETDMTGAVMDAQLPVAENPGAEIRVRLTNAAGLDAVSDPVLVPAAQAWCGIPEWGPDTGPEDAQDWAADTVEPRQDVTGAEVMEDVVDAAVPVGRDGSGCGVGTSGSRMGGLLLMLLSLALFTRLRRSPSCGRGFSPDSRAALFILSLVLILACSSGPSSNHLAGPPPDTSAPADLSEDVQVEPLEISLSVGQEVPADLFGDGLVITSVEGALPFGLLLSHDGTLRGRPSVEQDLEVRLTLGSAETTESRTVRFSIRSGAPAVLVAHPPAGAVGWDYEHGFEVVDLDAAATWSLRRGDLPPGLELDPATGQLAGTPGKAGLFPFILRAEAEGLAAERAFAIRVGDQVLQDYAETFRRDGIEDLSPSGMILSRDPQGIYQDYGDSGMWNGTYAAGIAWRYAWLRTPDAAADLEYMLEDLTRFREVTGVPGLTCRGYEHDEWQEADLPGPQNHPDNHAEGHLSEAEGYEGWTWKGDTSRDQVTGLVLGNALIHDVAPTAALADAAAENLVAMALHVWDNDMQLVDPDGEMTTYGDCSAYSIEGFSLPGFPLPNGFGACLTGSWFVAGAHAAAGEDRTLLEEIQAQILGEEPPGGDAKNPGEYDYLGTMDESFYSFQGYDTRWYNINLASDSFYTFARLFPDGPIRDRLIGYWTDILWTDKGEENTKRRVQSLENPWWSFLYLAGTQRYDADAAYEGLVQLINFMPPPRLGVDIHNSDLYPVDPDSPVDAPWTFEPLPASEQCSGTNFVWQRNPFALDCGGRADTQWAGTDFLAPYWLGVVYGYVSENL